MSNNSFTPEEMLKFAMDNGMLDVSSIQAGINMKHKREFLEKHKYTIWEGKDHLWYTYVPDEKKGRILKKRNTKDEIENCVIEFYQQEEENPTIKQIYVEWIQKKLDREEISRQTRDRYDRQFEQCFEALSDIKIKSIEEIELEDFMLNTIHEKELTVKGFSNMRTLVFGIFKYAKKKRLTTINITDVVNNMEISRKAFRREQKADNDEVFMLDEIPRVTEYLEENKDMINLGLLLLFKTGMRIGELSALKWSDVTANSVSVCRTEISYKDENKKEIYEVRDFPKSDAGIRQIAILDKYSWIINRLKSMNPFGEYVFETAGVRIKAASFRSRLRTVCKHSKIKSKSPHKIRKTYGSILLDSTIPESVVISQMGHTDIRTTKDHYYKNMRTVDEMRNILEEVKSL